MSVRTDSQTLACPFRPQVTQAPHRLSDTAAANMQRALAVVSLAFAFSARALNRPVTAAAARVKRLSRDEEIKLADIAQRASRQKVKRDALAAELGRPPTAEEWAGRVKEHKCALARARPR